MQRPAVSLLFLLALAATTHATYLHAQTTPSQPSPIALTQQGRVLGHLANDGATLFEAIPYAKPPVGDLRWRDPEPAAPWSDLRDATHPPHSCMQMNWGWNAGLAKNGSEDCLYLNVATPAWPPTAALPVIVWIHGGANYNGSGQMGDQTLTRRGVVLVTINYRLGVFGFLAHPDLTRESAHSSSGDYALLDQIAALRWVRQNIANFGGDPDNVTIAGQSAGAIDLGALLVSPLARGLFRQAIAESGGPVMPFPILSTPAKEESIGTTFAASTGRDIAHLRVMPADQLLEAANRFAAPDSEGVPTQDAPALSVDHWALPDQPAALVEQGSIAVPLLIGSNAQEFTFTRSSKTQGNTPEPADEVRARILTSFGAQAEKAIALYGLKPGHIAPPDPLLGTAGTQFMTDTYFRCPATITAGWQSDSGGLVWLYQFEHPAPGDTSTHHSGELAYVFGAPLLSNSGSQTFGPADRQTSTLIQTYWTNFARTGDPNGAGAFTWPRYSTRSGQIMRFTPTGPIVSKNARIPLCTLYGLHIQQELTPAR